MSKTLTAVTEPVSIDNLEPAADPAFEAVLRSFEREAARKSAPRLAPVVSVRRDPYYLD